MVDDEGRHFQILDEILEHRKDETALEKGEGYMKRKNGPLIPKKTTKGWDFLVH